MITIYGIKNCDTVKRTRKTLEEAGISFRYHDFRQDGLDAAQIETWLEQLGSEALINRRGTTWRKLDEAQRSASSTEELVALLQANPSLIKRPVIEHDGETRLGFARKDETSMLAWLQN